MTIERKYSDFYAADDAAQPELSEMVFTGWPTNRFEAILAERPSGNTLLDIGCGDGKLLFQLRRHFERLYGVEYSKDRLAQARRHLRNYQFVGVHGSAEDLAEIETETIDYIVCADVIEHIPDVYAATSEMYRVLRAGGVMVINTPNIAFLVKRLKLLFGRFPSTSQPNEGLGSDVLFDGGHLHYFTFRSLALLLKRGGFKVKKRIGYGPFGKLHDFFPAVSSVGVQLVVEKPLSLVDLKN